MKKRKRTGLLAIILSAALLTGLFGCNSSHSNRPEDGKLQIVTTIFPEYDWMMQVLGESEKAEVILLMDSGTDLHSFQPSARDISRVSNCDLLVYVGGESDEWIEDVLDSKINQNMKTINLLEVLGDKAKEEEIIEGMEGEHEEESEYDEHVWLSLVNAEVFVRKFAEVMAEIDPDNRITYLNNATAYIGRLDDLHQRYKKAVENSEKKTLVFADRFPFRYLIDDYGLNYYAAFAGCSAESEASFETISFLAQKVDEYGLNCVVKIEGGNERIAQTVINNTKSHNQKIIVLDSLQSTTARQVAEGTSYLTVMENNLNALIEALK